MTISAKDFTKGPIFKQLITLALPITATNFVQMAYSLTDMAWVGRLGSESVAAIGAVGILMWLSSSASMLSKIAAEVSIGQAVGAKKTRRAMAFASHTSSIGLISGLFVMALLFLGADIILSFFKLENRIFIQSKNYLQIVSTAVPFTSLAMTFSGIYNGSGHSRIPFFLISAGLVCNMILDPLLIFGIGPIPSMGIEGAAIATWISQALVFSLFIWQMKKSTSLLKHFPLFIRLRKRFIIRILQLGFPVTIMNFFFSFINMYMARIASIYGGHIGVSSQTTGGQIEGITWNTSSGFSTALGAFVAQNYAAGKMKRARKAYRYTLASLLSLGVIVTMAFLFFGETIFGLIIPERTAAVAGGEYLKILGFSQLFMMLEMTTQGMFNGIGRTVPPAIVSIVFNFSRIPLALILASQLGIIGVWWTITISSVLKGIVLPLWLSLKHKKNKNL